MTDNKIMIVDDEPANLAILREFLAADYKLLLVRDGAEAIDVAAKQQPSLILLDISMPRMDGYQVCRALKANPITEAIPVIFVTALSDETEEEVGFDAGCVDYLIKPVRERIVKARVRAHLSLVKATKLERSRRDALMMLGKAGEYNDNCTGMHLWRMAAYSRCLAEAIGWPADRCELMELAAPMHDIGKIGIPDSVLRKPDKLNDEEWLIMRSHCRIGYEILSASDALMFELAAEIALRHHEKWDGSGYPNGLSGNDIPESARIVAVADVFDALTMERPYKDAWPTDKAIEIIQHDKGKHFEPRLIDAFIARLPRILEIKAEWDGIELARRTEADCVSTMSKL
jgi:putative two-component system response regulator